MQFNSCLIRTKETGDICCSFNRAEYLLRFMHFCLHVFFKSNQIKKQIDFVIKIRLTIKILTSLQFLVLNYVVE